MLVTLVVGLFAVGPVLVPGGEFAPLYGLEPGQRALRVAPFRLDVRQVSGRAFAAFVATHPEWAPGKVASALADERYLAQLDAASEAPVTSVSYFAARAYCAAQGGRLPTTLEWEYVAAASEQARDATFDPAFVQRILDWYAAPAARAGSASPANVYGVEALHGLAWEWTEDFNADFADADGRGDGQGTRFACGAAAAGTARRADYAAFMRFTLRTSLSPRSVLPTLSFRCAYDLKGGGR